jgi:hypothetical protein
VEANNKKSESLSLEQVRLLVQLHCAEYQMLMTRIIHRTNQQYLLWGALVGFITLGAVATGSKVFPHPQLLIWGSVFISQLVTLFWIDWQTEIHLTFDYIRNTLRLSILPLVEDASFWNDDAYLERIRGKWLWWEWMPLLIATIAVALTLYVVSKDFLGSLPGLAVNVITLGFVFYKAVIMDKARNHIFENRASGKPS